MTPSYRPLSPLTRRRLLFGLGSTAGAGVISPALAVTSGHGMQIGSKNRVSQAELDRIVVRHQLWLDRKSGGELANLSRRDLSGLNFGRWDLRYAIFAEANLSGIHATDTRFCYCDFTSADMTGMQSVDCDFRAALLARAKLVHAYLRDSREEWPIPDHDEDLWYCGGGLIDAFLDDADLRKSVLLVRT